MNTSQDCKPISVDVTAPQIPMVIAVFAVVLAFYTLFKVLELEQRNSSRRD